MKVFGLLGSRLNEAKLKEKRRKLRELKFF
jgi:hypothetical protein